MKKIYLLSLLCCASIAAFCQTQTYLFANAGAGTYKTGYSSSTTRFDNTIITNVSSNRGYAVFDLASIPAGATITDVEVGMYCTFYGGGSPGSWNTYGYPGDLSTVTVPATLFADMIAGSLLYTSTYGTGVANEKLPSTAAAITFVQSNIGSKVSICWTGGGTTYQFAGETGPFALADTTTFGHAPYIRIKYCLAPTGVSATASPLSMCEGDVLTLTGAATGATNYQWDGPGGYSSTSLSPTLTTTTSSSGVYTLTATNVCGTASASVAATTSSVVVNPLPGAISGTNTVCTGTSAALSTSSFGGNWSSSDATIADVGSVSGVVTGVSSGSATITYGFPTGCYVTYPFTVNDPPTAISGLHKVCVGSSITLTNGVGGGAWSSSTGAATVGVSSGVVNGVSGGTTTISYVTTGCPGVAYSVTVDALPSSISGPSAVCRLSTITLSDPTPGGTWSSSNITIAMVGTGGVVTGVAGGSANIIYTDGTTGCQVTKAVVVNTLPAAIGGPVRVCEGLTMIATETTPGGTYSGGAPNASITSGGVVTGITAGAADITYTITATGCLITENIFVDPSPAAIVGTPVVCEGSTVTLTDPDPGGRWASAIITTATVGSSTGVVSGLTAGTTNISYIVSGGCSAVVTLTVNAAPSGLVVASGPTAFCAGGTVDLMAATGAGLTYQWYNGSTPIPGGTNATYTAGTSGAYKVDVTNAAGCTTTSAVTDVTAGFSVVTDYATPLNFCIGDHVVLTANTGGAVGTFTYQWKLNGTDITGAIFNTYTASANGIYTVVVDISGGSGACSATSAPVTVAVNALPTPSINYNGTLLYTGTYAAYQWYLNGVGVSGANSQTYLPLTSGSYRVRVTDGIGCPGYSGYYYITGVGVPQVNATSVEIYPNPATDAVHVEASGNVRAVISNMAGQQVIEQNNAKDINISHLAAGLYIIKVYDENGSMLVVQKLTKE